ERRTDPPKISFRRAERFLCVDGPGLLSCRKVPAPQRPLGAMRVNPTAKNGWRRPWPFVKTKIILIFRRIFRRPDFLPALCVQTFDAILLTNAMKQDEFPFTDRRACESLAYGAFPDDRRSLGGPVR